VVPFVRPIERGEAALARGLIAREFGDTRYEARMLELLDCALRGGDDTCLVAVDGSVRGLLIYTEIAGAIRVARVSCLIGGAAFRSALIERFLEREDRISYAELPDDMRFTRTIETLENFGFSEESAVPDFLEDGVSLRVLVKRSPQ
jgi:hypothetical protein